MFRQLELLVGENVLAFFQIIVFDVVSCMIFKWLFMPLLITICGIIHEQ
mgnify:FL=1